MGKVLNYALIIAYLFLIVFSSSLTIRSSFANEERTNTQLSADYFGLSPTRSASGKTISPDKLGSSEYCGHCHTQVFQQWNASSHHFSSFNNPIYRKIALATAQKKGTEALKFCAGCHDPLPLLSGEMDNLDLTSWSSNAGITCLACHRITEVHGGNGNYVIDEPTLHPFALAEDKKLQKLHKIMLEVTPQLHTKVLNKPFYSSAEYCATCHTLNVPKEINGTTDITLQDEYSEWLSSHYAGTSSNQNHKAQSSSEHGDKQKTCIDCHMPLVESDDPAAKDGLIKSHHFPGGNTLLPTFNRDEKLLQATEKFLQNNAIKVSIAGARKNAKNEFRNIDSIKLIAGDNVDLALQVQNTGVGHNFPAGTIDSNESWLELTVTDSLNRTIFNSGGLDSDGEITADSIKFGATLVDSHGNKLDRRNSTSEAVAIQQLQVIPPGAIRQFSYSFTLPDSAVLPITVNAKLNWRKYSPSFAQWVFAGRPIPEVPITVMTEAQVTM